MNEMKSQTTEDGNEHGSEHISKGVSGKWTTKCTRLLPVGTEGLS